MKHAWLAVDPGITTGWALLDDSGKVLGTSAWGTAELRASLDLLVRTCYTQGVTLTAIVEMMPSTGGIGPLARKLEAVWHDILMVVEDTYEIPVTRVPPGEWKPSRVARTTRLPGRWKGELLLSHQHDAIRMGRYVIDKQREKT